MSTGRKFEVGDRVRVVADCRWCGEVTTIMAIETVWPGTARKDRNYPHSGEVCYLLDLHYHPSDRGVIALARHIRHVYDGNQRIAWSDCVWKPEKETV